MSTNDLLQAIIAQPVLSGVQCLVGAEYRHEEDAPGRVVFVPGRAHYAPAERHKANTNPRAFRTRVALVEAWCWAGTAGGTADMDAAEVLLNNVCAAIHLTTGDYELLEDEPPQAEMEGGQISTLGMLRVLRFELRAPVTLPLETKASVTGLPTTTSMQFANGHLATGSPTL